MNGRNRHKKYRVKVYQRRGIGTILISVAATLAIVAVTLLIVGNILKAQTDKRHNDIPPDTSDIADTTETTVKKAKALNGRFIDSFASEQTFVSAIDGLKANGIPDASIFLTDTNGELLYDSRVAEQIGRIHRDSVSLAQVASLASERETYLSGVYCTHAFSVEDKLLRAVELSNDAAIVAEALDSGLNEVIIYAPHMTADHVSDMMRLIKSVRDLTQNGFVGIVVNDVIFEHSNASLMIKELSTAADILAMKAFDTDNTSAIEYVSGKISSANKFYLHMYKMRVLLPCTNDPTIENELITIAQKNGINNFQTLKNLDA